MTNMLLAVQLAKKYPSLMTDNNKYDQCKEVNSTSNSNTNKIEKIQKNNNNIIYYKNIINIGTHNVMGFNQEYKQRESFDEYKDLDLDIIGLSETKLNE